MSEQPKAVADMVAFARGQKALDGLARPRVRPRGGPALRRMFSDQIALDGSALVRFVLDADKRARWPETAERMRKQIIGAARQAQAEHMLATGQAVAVGADHKIDEAEA